MIHTSSGAKKLICSIYLYMFMFYLTSIVLVLRFDILSLRSMVKTRGIFYLKLPKKVDIGSFVMFSDKKRSHNKKESYRFCHQNQY